MDDLLGMDFTTAPSQQTSGPPKPPPNYGRTTFDYLAASGSTSTQQPKPQPHYTSSSSPLAKTISPNPSRPISPAAINPPNRTADAFAALFGAPSCAPAGAGAGAGAGAKAGATLSMAERLAQESAAKIGGLGSMGPSSASWAGLNPSRPASAASGGSRSVELRLVGLSYRARD